MLPTGWKETNLGSICTFKYGKSLPKTTRSGGEVPVYGSNGVVGHHDTAITTGKTIIIGRKGSYGEISFSENPCWPIDTAYFVDETSTEQDLKWLSYRLTSLGLNQLNKAAAIPGLNREDAYRQELLVPPLAEQRRIAAILDQADALRTKRREALAQLDSLTQSIFIDMFGDPATNSATSNLQPLESLLEEPFQNGAYFPKETYCESGGAEMVHMSDAFGGCVRRGQLKRVNCSDEDVKKYSLSTNDILIARRSLTYEGAAKPCMIPPSNEPLIFESSFIRIRPNNTKITPIYLFHYLNNERVKNAHIRPYVTKSTISGINQSNLAQVPVMQPPLKLQQEFGMRVQSIEKMQLIQVSSLSVLTELFTSLQHRAFQGNL
jgi:type I restriction enzyme S subunit